MMQDLKNFGLAARSRAFDSVIANTICTDVTGKIKEIESEISLLVKQFAHNRDHNGSVYIIGNGGSAAVASHAITDFVNVCKIRAFTLHESSLITCMANDFGYENAYAHLVNTMMCPSDILIAISSSGKSANICNAVKTAVEAGYKVITLSGFKSDNPLRKLGHVNFWLDSCDYGLVEIGHSFILHNLSDRFHIEVPKEELVAIAD